jgi:hypothetical protein
MLTRKSIKNAINFMGNVNKNNKFQLNQPVEEITSKRVA